MSRYTISPIFIHKTHFLLFVDDYDALLCPKHANCRRILNKSAAASYRCFARIANADIHGFRIANAEKRGNQHKAIGQQHAFKTPPKNVYYKTLCLMELRYNTDYSTSPNTFIFCQNTCMACSYSVDRYCLYASVVLINWVSASICFFIKEKTTTDGALIA